MTRHSPLFLALTATAMALVGWNFGGNSVEKPTPDSQPTSTRSARPERPARIRPGPTGEAAQRLEGIRTASNAADRMRATIALARSLPPAEFAKWLNAAWFTPRGGMEDLVFTRILMERWAKEAPEGLLVWGLKNESYEAETLLTTWAETEPQRLLDFFKNHPDDEKELDALSEIASKHPELALRRLQEMLAIGISTEGAHEAGYVLKELAKKSPSALEAVLDTLPNSLRPDVERYLIGRKMEDSFSVELHKLFDRPDGFNLFTEIFGRPLWGRGDSKPLKGKLLDELANLPASWRLRIASDASTFLNLDDAAKWAAMDLEGVGFTPEQAKQIRVSAISSLSFDQQEIALKMMAEHAFAQDEKAVMIASLFSYLWNRREQAEPLLALLSSDEEREIARKALQPPPDYDEPEIKQIEQPAEWLTTVAALNSEGRNSYEYLQMLDQWEPERIAALSASFHFLPEDQKQKLAKFIGRYADINTPLSSEIVAYLVSHPSKKANGSDDLFEGESPIALASNYVTALGEQQPEKAGEWIEALPDGDAKFYATKNLQSVWSLYDPAAAERWFKSLPAALQTRVTSLK